MEIAAEYGEIECGGESPRIWMPSEESRLIEALRVFCIIAMMWVHVNPGLSSASAVTTGGFAVVGIVFGDTLGRVSVSLLSFISGYLVWHRSRAVPFGRFAERRFRSVLVPMLVWSALFILLAVLKEPLTGVMARKIEGIDLDSESLANAWAGITGPTANLSLFFLRDLFVAALILRAALPVVERFPAPVAALMLAIGSGEMLEPVIFRAAILQFVFFGAVAARVGVSLTNLSRPRIALPLGYLLTVIGIATLGAEAGPVVQSFQIPTLTLRLGICLIVLALARALMPMVDRTGLHLAGRHAYLAYLMHVPFLGVLWVLWRIGVGGPEAPAYVVFYLAAPLAAFGAAVVLGIALDGAPGVLQMALRGRIVRGPSVVRAD